MLRLQNIKKTFNEGTISENRVFRNLSLHIEKGDFVSIIGSNGAGKSTLMNLISGSIIQDSGSVRLGGQDISQVAEHDRCQKIARVFQDPKVGTIPDMTIFENMSIAKSRGKRFDLSMMLKTSNTKFFKEELGKIGLGLEEKLHNKVSLLSGGQRQSVSLLMATMTDSDLLLLDEHTAALDPKTSEIIMDLTEKIVSEKKMTTLMITHNLSHAIRYGNRLLMMDKGQVIFDIRGEEKKKLTQEKLVAMFKNLSDRSILSA